MFDEILTALGPQLTSGGALVAFLALTAASVVIAWLRARTQQLRIAVARDDASAVTAVLSRRFNLRTERLTKEQTFALATKTLDHEQSRFKYLVLLVAVLAVIGGALVCSALLGEPDAYAGWCVDPGPTVDRDPVPPCDGPGREVEIELHGASRRESSFRLTASRGLVLLSEDCDLDDGDIVACDFEDNLASIVAVRCGEGPGTIIPHLRLEFADQPSRELPRCL